jgi:hypothetical protein
MEANQMSDKRWTASRLLDLIGKYDGKMAPLKCGDGCHCWFTPESRGVWTRKDWHAWTCNLDGVIRPETPEWIGGAWSVLLDVSEDNDGRTFEYRVITDDAYVGSER